MQQAVAKVAREVSRESIEFLFRPSTMFEMFLRIDLDKMRAKITEWFWDDSPSAMPHRFRPPYLAQMKRAVEVEEFYRALVVELGP